MHTINNETITTTQYRVGYKAKGFFCETQYINVKLLPEIVDRFNSGTFLKTDYEYLKWELMKATGIPTGNLGIDTIKIVA